MSRLPLSIPGALIREAARSDLRDTLLFLGARDPSRALQFAQAFARTVGNMVAMPNLGSLREMEDARLRGLRVWPVADFKAYLLFYKPLLAADEQFSNDGIEVIRVLHHSRDYELHLSDDTTFDDS